MTYTGDDPARRVKATGVPIEGDTIGVVPPVPDRPAAEHRNTDYHDTVRWGPIFAGIVVSIISQLMLSTLGASIGGFAAGDVAGSTIGTGLGVWAIISLLISLFLGGWIMAASCGPMNNKTAILNALIMWATTLVLSGWLLAGGLSGTFGTLASNAGSTVNQVTELGGVSLPNSAQVAEAAPNITAAEGETYAANAGKAGLTFAIGSLLGLAATLISSTVGATKPRTAVEY